VDALDAPVAPGEDGRRDGEVAFPGVFRGALDVRARDITEGMKLAAGNAIAAVIRPDELGPEYIVPSVFNRDVVRVVAAAVAEAAEREGLPEIFRAAGFEWRKAGCSMCLGMNDDKLKGREMSASTSNRNFIGRQGSPTGRTLLMSPAMAAAAALHGAVTDVREMLR
jgi:hypothetical protein